MRNRLIHFLSRGSIWTSIHFILTLTWIIMVPLMIIFGWWESVPFLAVISVYANIVGHWSAWQAAHSEEKSDDQGGDAQSEPKVQE